MEATMTKATAIWKKFEQKRPVVISGPCSAETEEQVLETARQLAATGKVDILRAGIWKPRTKPGNFEGVGAKGFSWLDKAREITGLPYCVEVAKAGHVEEALRNGADFLWIGARTTANPFSIQEIADAIRGVDIPVFIKNPISPDLQLWIGGIQRIEKAGIKKIAVIHRGFSNFGETKYRNSPMWHIPIELKRLRPDLPIISDPSHICGRRDTLLKVAQKAADLDFDGVMLESHITPDKAWSDAKQQVTPQNLAKILEAIIWRYENSEQEEFITALARFREQINRIDDEILSLLSNRMKVAEEIGKYKKVNAITILQTNRWNDILEKSVEEGKELGLSKKFILKFLDSVHIESINHQNKIMNSSSVKEEI